MAALVSRRTVDKWTVPPALLTVPKVHVPIMNFFTNVYRDAALFRNCRHFSLLQWSDRWRGLLYSVDAETPLPLDTSAEEASVRKEMTPHPDAGLSLFVSRLIEKDELVRYYYTLWYTQTRPRRSTTRDHTGREWYKCLPNRFGSGWMC